MIEPTRRGFLTGLLVGGGALTLAVTLPGCGGNAKATRIEHAGTTGELAANMYVTVKPDGRIAVAVNKCEFGQGVMTAFATLVAEELEVPLDHVDVHFADSKPEYRTSFGMHSTGGSTSTLEIYDPLRTAAAAAREMLVAAAAASWGVPVRECTAAGGRVAHAATKHDVGYGDLTKLAAAREVPGKPRLKARSEFTLIGKTSRRIDARGKVDGTATFGIDVAVPNMVVAILLHPPQFGARAKSIDDAAARKRPGVIDIFATDDGVAIVADKYWQARAAAQDVVVTWARGDTAGLDTEKLRVAMRDYQPEGTTTRDDGNADHAFERAKTKLDVIYEAPYLAHATMEPQNCTVHVTGDRAEVWAPCQGPTLVQAAVALIIGGHKDDVLVHTTLAGGGFGRRFNADFAEQAARIAVKLKRPVKLVWSREDDMTGGFYRPATTIAMRGGLDASGRTTAFKARVVAQSITLSSGGVLGAVMPGIPDGLKTVFVNSLLAVFGTNSFGDLFATEGLKDTPYDIPNVYVDYTPVRTKMPVSSWRSVGHSVNGFAAESFIDELAHAADAEPLAFRRKHLKPASRQARVLDALAKLSKWGSAKPKGIGRGLARHLSFETEVGEVAEVEIVDDRIKVRRVYCVVDCGIAVNPGIVRSQMESAIIFGLSAALDQQITIVDGVVQQKNYDTFPPLRMFEAPEIIVEILDSDHHPSGVGEPGLPPVAAATANAIFDLTGVRLRRLPLQQAWLARGAK